MKALVAIEAAGADGGAQGSGGRIEIVELLARMSRRRTIGRPQPLGEDQLPLDHAEGVGDHQGLVALRPLQGRRDLAQQRLAGGAQEIGADGLIAHAELPRQMGR